MGVSPDPAETQRRFREAHHLPFPLVADTKREVIKLYGVERRLLRAASAQRVTFLIDTSGVIARVFHHELAVGKHRSDVLRALKRLNEPLVP